MFDLEKQIGLWRHHLSLRSNMNEADIDELESHLRDEMEDLKKSGLADDEAFLLGVKRIGNIDMVTREYSKVSTENVWKQLILVQSSYNYGEILFLVVLCLAAGSLAKIPEFFGQGPLADGGVFYVKNYSLFILPFIAVYFIWKLSLSRLMWVAVLLPFVLSVLIINLYPSIEPHHNALLAGIHLPILLWTFIGLAYTNRNWRTTEARMDFLRFTGEAFIYTTLIFLSLFVLVGFAIMIFASIAVNAQDFIRKSLLTYGIVSVPIIAAYLVEAKKSVVENIAPVLAKIFSPLFLIVMLSFLLVMVILNKSPFMEREFLIGFDLMLVLVLGLVLYEVSARPGQQKPDIYDYINFSLIVAALAIDIIALSAIIFRLSTFGLSPNKLAALGENVIMLVNLSGIAVMYLFFILKKSDFSRIERWITLFIPVYGLWAAVVVILFPILFGFR
ncbi:permease prefix domain 1-containing protein [candidate division KSB1 bacterium]